MDATALDDNTMNAPNPLSRITSVLGRYGGALIAYSGGVDSTLLAALAHEAYGDKMIAVFARSPFVSRGACEQARDVASEVGFPFLEIEHPGFGNVASGVDSGNSSGSSLWNNPQDRCYLCKRSLLEELQVIAGTRGLPVVMHGENLDDLGEDRPGALAAQELGVVAPFVEAEMDKAAIRELAREMALSNADTPSDSCLATRFPFDVRLEQSALDNVACTEERLREIFPQATRIRARVTHAPSTPITE